MGTWGFRRNSMVPRQLIALLPFLCNAAAATAKKSAANRRFFDNFGFNNFYFTSNSFSDSSCFNSQYNSQTDSGQCANNCCWGSSCGSENDCKTSLIIGMSIMCGILVCICGCIAFCFFRRTLCFRHCCPREPHGHCQNENVSYPQPIVMGGQPIGHIVHTQPMQPQQPQYTNQPGGAPPPAYIPTADAGGPPITKSDGGAQA